MKIFLLFCLVGFVFSQGLDFILDNILFPLLIDIQNNALDFLSSSLTNLIGSLFGKRELAGLINIQSLISGLVENLQIQITGLISTVIPQLGNLIQGINSRVNFESILANFNIDFTSLISNFLGQITAVTSSLIGGIGKLDISSTISSILNELGVNLSTTLSLFGNILIANAGDLATVFLPIISSIGKRDISDIFSLILSLLNIINLPQLLSNINIGSLISIIPANLISLAGKRDLVSTIQSHIQAIISNIQIPTQVSNFLTNLNISNFLNTNFQTLVQTLGKRDIDIVSLVSTYLPVVLAMIPPQFLTIITNFNMNMIPSVISALAQLG